MGIHIVPIAWTLNYVGTLWGYSKDSRRKIRSKHFQEVEAEKGLPCVGSARLACVALNIDVECQRLRGTFPKRMCLLWRGNRSRKQVTVLSRGVRSLFGPIRKSSPWDNFSDGGLNQSINQSIKIDNNFPQRWWKHFVVALSVGRLIDWLIDDSKVELRSWFWLDWFIRLVQQNLFFRGRG